MYNEDIIVWAVCGVLAVMLFVAAIADHRMHRMLEKEAFRFAFRHGGCAGRFVPAEAVLRERTGFADVPGVYIVKGLRGGRCHVGRGLRMYEAAADFLAGRSGKYSVRCIPLEGSGYYSLPDLEAHWAGVYCRRKG